MADETRTFVSEFVASVEGFVQNIGKAASSLERLEARITKSILAADAIEKVFTKGFQLISDVVEKAIVDTANYGDEILALSKKTGTATDTLGGLVFAFQQGNASQEDLSAGLRGLSKNLELANEGSKQQAAAFNFLGISTKDATGHIRPMNDILLDVADRFNTLPDGAEKAALANAIFGKSGSALIPTLSQGSEEIRKQTELAQRFGAVMGTEAAEAGDRFNDALAETQLAVRGLSFAIGEHLLPILTVLIQDMNEWIAATTNAVKHSALLELTLRALTSPLGAIITHLQTEAEHLKTGADLAFEHSERVKALSGSLTSFADAQKQAADAAALLKKQQEEAARATKEWQKALIELNFERIRDEQNAVNLAYSELIRIWMEAAKAADELTAAAEKLKVALDTEQVLSDWQAFQRTQDEQIRIWIADQAEIDKQNQEISERGIALWKDLQRQATDTSKSFEVALGNITSESAKAFSDLLLNANKFNEDMVNVFRTGARSMLSAVIAGFISPFTEELGKLGKKLADFIDNATRVGGFLSGAGGIFGSGALGILGPIGAAFGIGSFLGNLFGGRNNEPAPPNSVYFPNNPFGSGGYGASTAGAVGTLPTYGPDSAAYLAASRPVVTVNINGPVVGPGGIQEVARYITDEIYKQGRWGGMQIVGAQ